MFFKRLFTPFNLRHFSRRQRLHFIINLLIGVFILVLLQTIEETAWGESTLDAFLDRFISAESSKAAQVKVDIQRTNILFIDFDNRTVESWGRPLLTPRHKIAEIINLAYAGRAKLIVLDILLEERDCCNPQGDEQLRAALKNVLSNKGNSLTKIIFAQSVGADRHLCNSLFDDLLESEEILRAGQERKFYGVTPQVGASASDSVVRYWDVFEMYVDKNEQRKILWGLPLISACLFSSVDLVELENYGKELLTFSGEDATERIHLGKGKRLKLSHRKSDRYLQRIRFRVIPEMISEPGRPGEKKKIISNLDETRIAYDEARYYQDYFKDKIIIIGNSSPVMGDIHRTPVGEMAGMYIQGNAINTILYSPQPSPPPAIVTLLIEALVIIMAAYSFLYFTSILAQVLASTVIVLVLGFVSYLFFIHTGIFLNFAFALVGMGLHRTAADIEYAVEKKGRAH